MQNKESKFKVGDYAYKPKGYSFPCQIRSVFTNISGETRVVAEMVGKSGAGMLHIFNENQLEHPESWDKGMREIVFALDNANYYNKDLSDDMLISLYNYKTKNY